MEADEHEDGEDDEQVPEQHDGSLGAVTCHIDGVERQELEVDVPVCIVSRVKHSGVSSCPSNK